MNACPLGRGGAGGAIFMELVPDFLSEKGYLVGGGPGGSGKRLKEVYVEVLRASSRMPSG